MRASLDRVSNLAQIADLRSAEIDAKVRNLDKRLESLERLNDLRTPIAHIETVLATADERATTFVSQLSALDSLLRVVEERSRTMDSLLRVVEERSRTMDSLLRVVEERSRTLEYETRQGVLASNYQIDFLLKLYVEAMSASRTFSDSVVFDAARLIELKTDFPIAYGSNDHLSPDSTMEGVSRPTLFVQNCIAALGKDMRALDLGTGAAGIVYEFAMNGVLAVGIDGSDFCRRNKIGYWPLLDNNLFTCDITREFDFVSRDTNAVSQFDLVTMWEVLEHIGEEGFPSLFANIRKHLRDDGFFIGSVSFVEYNDPAGNPYHVTLKPWEWWEEKFREFGLEVQAEHPFNEKWFPRGNGPRFQDFHNYERNPDEGRLFVARKAVG
ncbi:hypothetical protein CI15_03235 [Paraburkholderia monticola]|uniref:Uncharacterized protein n=1 Tax=Paraburkholderia monticola TaxID=1399968 RepID=A0A149Q0V7_9BURK|nr:hypothetical protein CI15_03235 [Paraburkholderia monticola]